MPPSSPPNLSPASTQAERDFLRSLHRVLQDLQRFPTLFEQLPYLNQLLQECFEPFNRLIGTSRDPAFADAVFSLGEAGLDYVARKFQSVLRQPNPARLRDITAETLTKPLPVAKTERLTRCLGLVEQFANVQNGEEKAAKVVDRMVGAMKYESMPLGTKAPSGDAVQDQWVYHCALFMLMQVARILSKQFQGREVVLVGDIVPGTGSRSLNKKPVEREAKKSDNGEGTSVSASAAAAGAYTDCVREAEKMAGENEKRRVRERAEVEDGKALRLSDCRYQ